MNFPLISCAQFRRSEENSFLMSKISNNKEEKKEEVCTSSNGNDKSTNSLEIIDYPYPSNYNQEVSFINSGSEIKFKGDETNETINNESYMRLHELIEEKLNMKNSLNSSSCVLNNEDSITQNKIILQNLYNNHNNNVINKNSIKNNKIQNGKNNTLLTKKNGKTKKKKIIKRKRNNYTLELKMEKYHPSSERFSGGKNFLENKVINEQIQTQRDRKEKNKKSKSKSKLLNNNIDSKPKKKNITRNQNNVINPSNTLNSVNKNKFSNILYFESFSIKNNFISSSSKSFKNKNNKKINLLFKQKIQDIINKKTKCLKINDIKNYKSNKKFLNLTKLTTSNETSTSLNKRKTSSNIHPDFTPSNLSNDYYKRLINRINFINNNFNSINKQNDIFSYQNKNIYKKINNLYFKVPNEQRFICSARRNIRFNPFDSEIKTKKDLTIWKHNYNNSEL